MNEIRLYKFPHHLHIQTAEAFPLAIAGSLLNLNIFQLKHVQNHRITAVNHTLYSLVTFVRHCYYAHLIVATFHIR